MSTAKIDCNRTSIAATRDVPKYIREDSERRLKRLGSALRKARENLRYSYRQLADYSGVSPSQLLRMESGEFDFSISNFLNVASALALPSGIILEWVSLSGAPAIKESSVHAFLSADVDMQTYSTNFENLRILMEQAVRVCIDLILSSNPVAMASLRDFPFKPLNERIRRFATTIDLHATNLERDARMKAILQSPGPRLRSIGVLDNALIEEYFAWCATRGPLPSLEPTFYLPILQDGLTEEFSAAQLAPVTATTFWPALRSRLSKLLAEPGSKVRLAKMLGVSKGAVSQWLSGASTPAAETALRLDKWVTSQEHKSPAGASTPTGQAQRKDTDETKSKTPGQKPQYKKTRRKTSR